MAARSESLAKWVARAPPRGPGNAKTTALIGREPGTSSSRGVPCGCEGGGHSRVESDLLCGKSNVTPVGVCVASTAQGNAPCSRKKSWR